MASKELITLAANAMEERRKELIAQPLSRIYPQLAEAAASAILTALLEPTEEMLSVPYKYRDLRSIIREVLAASALGDQN
jgi:hypothetical protein